MPACRNAASALSTQSPIERISFRQGITAETSSTLGNVLAAETLSCSNSMGYMICRRIFELASSSRSQIAQKAKRGTLGRYTPERVQLSYHTRNRAARRLLGRVFACKVLLAEIIGCDGAGD